MAMGKTSGFRVVIVFAAIAVVLGSIDAWGARPRRKAKAKGPTVAETIEKAAAAFDAYDFDGCVELLEALDEASGEPTEAQQKSADRLMRRAEMGQTMMRRVESIAIIDSLTVDSVDFFNAYRLSIPSGYIAGAEVLPEGTDAQGVGAVFVTESGETMMWGDGKGRLVETHLLSDGSWEQPRPMMEAFDGIVAEAYPFLMPDGATLYFGAKGEESLGGYDIFISRHNGEEFLQPQNMGMPYNSPDDDFMLAIDELTGAGWWATNRGHRGSGKVTIYVFVPQELRASYDVETPNLVELARVDSYRQSEGSGSYGKVLDAIAALDESGATDSREFRFAVPGGRIYTSMADFRNPAAAEAMERYLDASAEMMADEERLAELRASYSRGNSLVTDEILNLEKTMDIRREELRRLSNEVVRLEKPHLENP